MHLLHHLNTIFEKKNHYKAKLNFSGFNLKPTLVELAGGGKYEISGINARHFRSELFKVYGMSGMKNIWTEFTYRRLVFHKWFVPELLFMIDGCKKETKGGLGLLTDVENLLLHETWYKDVKKPVKEIINRKNIKKNLKWDPLEIQERYFATFDKAVSNFNFRGALAALAAGSGKSYTSLCVAEGVEADLVIIICPKATLYDPWIKTIPDVYKTKQNVWASTAIDQKHLKTLNNNTRFVIVHYEQINNVMDRLKKTHPNPKTTLVILDESHNLNNTKAARTGAYLDVIKERANYVVALSGTPIKATGMELVPMLRAIDPLFTKATETKFLKYAKGLRNESKETLTRRIEMFTLITEKKELGLKQYNVETQIIKLKNGNDFTLPVVSAKMREYARKALVKYNALRPEYLTTYREMVDRFKYHDEYPIFSDTLDVVVASSSYMHLGKEMQLINKFEANVVYPGLSKEDRKTFKKVRAVAKYPPLKVLGETLGVVLTAERIKCNTAIAASIDYERIMENGEGKTLVFSNNVVVTNAGAESVKTRKPLVITGETSKTLAEDMRMFYEDPKVDPLFTTYSSLSTGVPITCASEVVIIDSPFRQHTLIQSIARAWRLGNDKQVTVWYAQLDTGEVPNLNSRSLDIAKWSSDEVSDILGIKSEVEYPEAVTMEIVE